MTINNGFVQEDENRQIDRQAERQRARGGVHRVREMYVSFAILRIRDYVFLTIRTSPLEEYGLFSHPFIQTDWLFAWD